MVKPVVAPRLLLRLRLGPFHPHNNIVNRRFFAFFCSIDSFDLDTDVVDSHNVMMSLAVALRLPEHLFLLPRCLSRRLFLLRLNDNAHEMTILDLILHC